MEKRYHQNLSSNSSTKIKYPIQIGNIFKLSFGEEVGNSVSHGVMAVLLLIVLPFCAVYGYTKGGPLQSFGNSIYVISILLMFLSSSLYHSMSFDSSQKRILRKIDHSAIFVAIAGSFTPIILTNIQTSLGYGVLIVQWIFVIIGILFKSLSKKSKPIASTTLYLVMGWSAVLLIPNLIRMNNWLFLTLILFGGLLYSIGVYFYSQKSRAWYHFIWHLFIIGASVSHFIAIIFVL